MPKRTGLFTHIPDADQQHPVLDLYLKDTFEFQTIDNPDGVFTDPEMLGPYTAAPGGRDFSHGAGTPKGTGAASGHGRVMRVVNGEMKVPGKKIV